MAKITWDIHGGSQNYYGSLFTSLHYDALADAGAASFALKNTGEGTSIVFTGSFVVQGGAPIAGTVTGFNTYFGNVPMIEATGYVIDLDDLTTALGQLAGGDNVGIRSLFIDLPKTIRGSAESNDIFGGDAADAIYGRRGADMLFGFRGKDTLHGGDGKDFLDGGRGADRLVGGKGRDELYGEEGNDVLTGGAGKDTFMFDTTPGPKNHDRITDFAPGRDKIVLDDFVFSALTYNGTLKAKNFVTGSAPKDGKDHVIYNDKTGALFYDRDGSGDQYAAVKFAVLSSKPDLAGSDFLVI